MGDRRGTYRFWWGNLRGRNHLDDMYRRDDNSKMDFSEIDGKAWTGLMWLRTGINGRLLEMQ
jgi:hypothetical protein